MLWNSRVKAGTLGKARMGSKLSKIHLKWPQRGRQASGGLSQGRLGEWEQNFWKTAWLYNLSSNLALVSSNTFRLLCGPLTDVI